MKWFSRGLSGTLSGCIPPELARDGLQPREVPDRPRENHNTTRLNDSRVKSFFGGEWNFVSLKHELCSLFEWFELKNVNFQSFGGFKSCFQAQVVSIVTLGLRETSRKL